MKRKRATCVEQPQLRVLITGGTGSLGQALTEHLLARSELRRLVIYSRDEWKQAEMARRFPDPRLRFFLGDVRDRDRLCRATEGTDYLIHCAALKQVPACERDPGEAVKTNILGAQHVIEVALERSLCRVVALSSDKAANPVNLYGATKLCADKLFLAAHRMAGGRLLTFAVVRYGNVLGSRGSVVPLFRELAARGEPLPLTDRRMTRFWLTPDQAARFVLGVLAEEEPARLYVPKCPSMRIADLAEALAPGHPTVTTGIRSGEKLHETLIPEDESHRTCDQGSRYVILPPGEECETLLSHPVPDGWSYRSDTNDRWLSAEDLRGLVDVGAK